MPKASPLIGIALMLGAMAVLPAIDVIAKRMGQGKPAPRAVFV